MILLSLCKAFQSQFGRLQLFLAVLADQADRFLNLLLDPFLELSLDLIEHYVRTFG